MLIKDLEKTQYLLSEQYRHETNRLPLIGIINNYKIIKVLRTYFRLVYNLISYVCIQYFESNLVYR